MRFVAFVAMLLCLSATRLAHGAESAKPQAPKVTVTVNDKSWPSSPGFHFMQFTAHAPSKDIPMDVGIFLPRAYFQSAKPMPIVVTLHNRGNSGAGGGMSLAFEGLALLMARDNPDTRGTGDPPKNPINLRTDAQFIGLVPQCPWGYEWQSPPVPQILDAFITALAKHYHADEDRVDLTGFSYGGSSTWRVAMETPDRYAAIAPIDGRATPDPDHDVQKLKGLAIYQVIGSVDFGFLPEAHRMRDALKSINHPRYVYHVTPNGNHWGYASVYNDPLFWKWMLSQSRHGGATTEPSTLPSDVVAVAPSADSHTGDEPANVLCQYWRDLPGIHITDLTSDPSFPQFPGEQTYLTRMEIPANQDPGYATVLKALIHPPQTGEYTFYIASEDQGELWLSYDEKPAHTLQIAGVPEWSLPRKWTQDSHQQSMAIHLEQGKSYYMEARQKSGSGDNHLAVAWKLPDGTTEGPIPGSRFTTIAATDVPAPKIVSMDPKDLPNKPGSYRIKVQIDYLNHQFTLPLALILPQSFTDAKQPALVYFADTAAKPDADGFRITGPTKDLAPDSALAKQSTLILIAPQCPADQTWDKFLLLHASAAIVDKLLHDLPVDPERVYLTGSGSGATALWQLAPLLPGKFAAIAPICTMEIKDPQLPKVLEGTEVHIITGVQNGVATDCANRMKDLLASIHPAPDIDFQMQMGSEVADNYYAKPDFYQYLLAWRRPMGKAAVK